MRELNGRKRRRSFNVGGFPPARSVETIQPPGESGTIYVRRNPAKRTCGCPCAVSGFFCDPSVYRHTADGASQNTLCFLHNVATRAPVARGCKVIRYGAFPLSNKTCGKLLLCSVCCWPTNAGMSNASPLEYLRPAEAAKRLGISRNTLNRYLAKGLIRCSRPSLRCTLISTAELARFYSATAQPVPVSMVRAA